MNTPCSSLLSSLSLLHIISPSLSHSLSHTPKCEGNIAIVTTKTAHTPYMEMLETMKICGKVSEEMKGEYELKVNVNEKRERKISE